MKIILTICLLILSASAFSQDWSKLYPFTHCEEFYFEYQSVVHEGSYRYQVRIPQNKQYSEFKVFDQVITDLNNLEGLTDELSESSKMFCPTIELKNIDLISCLKAQENTNPLSIQYIDFSKNVMSLFDVEGMSCHDVNNLEFIGEELEKEKVTDLEYKPRTKNLFRGIIKLFVTDSSDDLVNKFGECGGKKFSRDFIRNSILLMAREQCIFPKPEGYLNFGDVVEMANELSKDYDNMSMLGLYKRSDKILDDSLKSFTQMVMKEQVAELLEVDKNDPKVDSILEKSKNWQFLQDKMNHTKKKIKYDGEKISRAEHIQDYITNVFATNVTFEIAELIIPDVIENNIKSQLPASWGEDRKNTFIKETIIPSVEENYGNCISPVKDDLGINNYEMTENFSKSSLKAQNEKDQEFINTRKARFAQYCDKFPANCNNDNKCTNKASLFLEDENVSEMNKIQSCLFSSFYKVIPDILSPVVDEAYEEAKKIEAIPEGKNKEIKEKALLKLNECYSSKIKDITGEEGYSNGAFNTKAALHLSSGQFSNTLTSCLDTVEDSVATDIMYEVVSANTSLKSSYEDLGDFDEEAYKTKVRGMVDQTYQECIDRQKKILTGNEAGYALKIKDPLICSTLLEIKASSMAIDNILKTELEKQGLKPNEIDMLVQDHHKCSEKAFDNAKLNIGALNSETPITDSDSANEYLDKNDDFLECTINSIGDISSLVSEDMYQELVKNKEEINDKNYALSLTPIVQKLTQECITKGTKLLGSWSKFTESITKPETLDELSKKCTKVVENEITGKIIIQETTNELYKIVNDGSLLVQDRAQNKFDIGNVLALTAYDLRKKYDLELPADIKSDEIIEWSVKNAYIKSVELNGSPDKFMEEYEKITELNAVKVIRKNLLEKLKEKSPKLKSANFDRLEEVITPSCTHKLYNNLKEELKPKPGSTTSTDTIVDQVIDFLGEGLVFLQDQLGQSEYDKKMNEIKEICQNSSQYKSLLDLQKTTAFDWVVKKVLHDEISPKFKEIIEEDYRNTIKAIAEDPFSLLHKKTLERKIEAANTKYKNLLKLHKEWFEDGKKFNQMLFDDDDITSFALLNIKDMLSKDSPKRKELEDKITKKIFNNTTKGSFADQFVKEQLLSGLIVSGTESVVDAAGEKARKKVWLYKDTTEGAARYHTREFWSPKKVREIFNWEGMGDSQRKKLLNTVVNKIVIPQSKNQAGDEKAVNDMLEKHIEDYKYPNGKKMSDYITDYVTPKTESDVKTEVVVDVVTFISPLVLLPF